MACSLVLHALVVLLVSALLADCQQLKVEVSPERRVVAAGKDVGFECGVILPPGHTFVSAIWQNSRTGQPISQVRHQHTTDGILILRNVGSADSGTYTCAARSVFRGRTYQNWAHATLSVVGDTTRMNEKPTITVYPQGSNGGLVRVRRGGTIEMNCMATGHPLPYLNWRRSSGQRLPAGRHQLQGGKLIITDVRIPDDVDQYECTATNTAGTASETRYVIGGWGSWGAWRMCSVSCGSGRQTRTRQCVVPPSLPSRLKSYACRGLQDARSSTGTSVRSCFPGSCPSPPTTQPPTTRPPATRPPPPTTTTRRQIVTRPVRIVQTTAVAVTTPTPPPMAVGEGLRSVGCFQDHVARRVLRYHSRSFWRFRQRMSPQLCVQHCERYGHRHAGVENQVECYCGYLDQRSAVPSDKCIAPCAANSGLPCGGINALSVYEVPQRNVQACETTKWGRWTQIKETCGWAVQLRTRTLRNEQLYCSNVPRLRMERLIMVRPCFDYSPRPPACQRVEVLKRLTYGFGGNQCQSVNLVKTYHCKGPCGGRCTFTKATSENVPFKCGSITVHIRVGKILSCGCRSA